MTALVCRGCCCGTDKHPQTDHDAQLAALLAVPGTVMTPCLGHCRWSNVVVHIDDDSGHQTWLGGVLDRDDTEAVRVWLEARAAGADDAGDLPPHLVRDPQPVYAVRAAQFAGRPAPTSGQLK